MAPALDGSVGLWPVEGLRAHPLAGQIPVMSAAERALLMEDVRGRGIHSRLEVTTEGVVLDGRHRLEVARELGLEVVPVRVVAPADEVEHMVRAALARRHLTASQRGALAVELAAFQTARAEAVIRQRANLRQAPEVAISEWSMSAKR